MAASTAAEAQVSTYGFTASFLCLFFFFLFLPYQPSQSVCAAVGGPHHPDMGPLQQVHRTEHQSAQSGGLLCAQSAALAAGKRCLAPVLGGLDKASGRKAEPL